MSTFEGYPFGAGVGEFGRIEIDALDFERAAIALNEMAIYMEDAVIPMRGAQRIAMHDMQKRFDTEIGPDGRKWAALDPDYAARKAHDFGFEHPILTGKTRQLRDAATDAEAWSISGESLFFNTSGLPEYWRVHQEGSSDFGSVFHYSFAEETGGLESSGGSGAQNIPPRPFIGLSEQAEAEILEEFDIWFGEGVKEAVRKYAISSSGVLQARLPSGRFGPKISL